MYHPDVGNIKGKRRKCEKMMVGEYHQLNEHESEQPLGDGKGQRSLACCSPWHHRQSDMT